MPDLSPDRWPELERIFHAAREREGAARQALLDDACAGDSLLRAEVESLLEFGTAASAFLTRPALEHIARTIAPPAAGALAGRQIHGYELRSLLGAGGMGEVYLARDLRLGREVALKILERSRARDPGYLRRFEDEARSASVLNHPNIVTIYGVGEDGDLSYIAMERVLGRTLREIIASADLAIPTVLDLGVQLANALAAAHDNGIIHRDLKPENVMVTPEGLVKVLDFGIAKREGGPDPQPAMSDRTEIMSVETQAGTILGTVGYMSPEQAEGLRATQASDQFSFGAVLYELLTGRRAFERSSKAATLEAIRRDPPEPIQSLNANVTMPLRRVVERCLEKDPAARYPRSKDLAAEIRQVRERIVGSGLSRRQVLWYGATAAAGVAMAGGTVWALWPRGPLVESLAVLPFENSAQDPEIDHLCSGLTDNLIRRLNELPGITAKPPSLVSNYKRLGLLPLAFAQKVKAEGVLIGSVEKRADDLTIHAQLKETATGKVLWSGSHTSKATDLQRLRDAVADAMVRDGIGLRLSNADQDRLLLHETNNDEAYDLFLRASLLVERGTEDDNIQARDLFEQAIALDPKFARAYVSLGSTYAVAAIEGWESPGECWPKSEASIRNALKWKSEIPEVHARTAAFLFFRQWEWEKADREWKQALDAPHVEMLPHVRLGRALAHWALGRTSEALRLVRELRVIDPLSPQFIVKEGVYLFRDGQFPDAVAKYEEALGSVEDQDSVLNLLAESQRAQGRFADAIEIWRKVYERSYDSLARLFATARGEIGCRRIDEELSRLALQGLNERGAAGLYVAPIDRARCHATLGQTKAALDRLDQAIEVHDPGVVFLKADKVWRPLHGNPRFEAVVKRVGLP